MLNEVHGLPRTLVEITVLATARRWNCQYEWVAHARIAREAGLAEQIIDAISIQVEPFSLAPQRGLGLRFCVRKRLTRRAFRS